MKTIIFFIILWQIGVVLKKVFQAATRQEQQQGGENDNRPGWQKKLIDAANKIKEEIEAQNIQSSDPKQTSWDHLTSGESDETTAVKKTFSRILRPAGADLEKEMLSRKDKQAALKKKLATKFNKPEYQPQDNIEGEDDVTQKFSEKVHSIAKDKPEQPKAGQKLKELKKAIVWKEILSKPVALREEKEGPFF